ncbi:4-phosphoerythronate dehydrogenase PdxB [bacterium]|nr:4-phosphoerythronate dehydrogenase PdxB [bacterium]
MKIVVDENIPFGREAFSTLGEVETSHGREITPEKVEDADVLIVRSITEVNSKLLEKSRVKFVGTATIGLDHIDVKYLNDRSIGFASAPGSNSNSVSEYIACALLYTANKLCLNLCNLTIGVVGVGSVGSKVAKKANALGMRVLLNDPPLFERTGNIKYRPIQELITNCDILTFHVPLERQGKYPTYHMIDEKFLRRLKKCPVIVNTSRGGVIDTEAIKSALMHCKISQVILDVWENEPDIDTGMLKMALIGTPHIAGYSFDGKVNGTFMIYNSLCQYLNKKAKWNPNDFLPDSNCPVIKVSEMNNGSLEKKLHEVISQLYDIEKDDSKLRESFSLPAEKSGAWFDSLRKNYPVRREFFNTEILFKKEESQLANILSEIGFKVDKI